MDYDSNKNDAFIDEFRLLLSSLDKKELCIWFTHLSFLIERYTVAYEMDGPIFLVLDNSILQDFFHKDVHIRKIRVLSYIAFCRFVLFWCDRETKISITPTAVYESSGKIIKKNAEEQFTHFLKICNALADTKLSITSIYFQNQTELYDVLIDIDSDAHFLKEYFDKINQANWKIKLTDGVLTKIPWSLALNAIPDNLPLKYFNIFWVKYVFGSHIEDLIIKHSEHRDLEKVITVPEMKNTFMKLNNTKRGALAGLGDIEILQLCDVVHQFKKKYGFTLHGQTFDKKLAEALSYRSKFIISGPKIEFGYENAEQLLNDSLKMMFSDPFKPQKDRYKKICDCLFNFIDVVKKTVDNLP